MTQALLSESSTAFVMNYLYYLLLTSHVCLFVDLSSLQKYPASRANHVIASATSALVPFALTSAFTFESSTLENLAGVGTAIITSSVFILFIQKVIKLD